MTATTLRRWLDLFLSVMPPRRPQSSRADAEDYAAFVSFRHVEPDRSSAKWLHRALETYTVPRRLARELSRPRRFGKVFLDEEELAVSSNLSRDIEDALRRSRHLIVVCSPQAVLSRWVNAEILFFRRLGRADKILALLIDGEPSTAFPPSLLEISPTAKTGGSTELALELAEEPLAADLRPVRGESRRGRRRVTLLRIAAGLIGCRYDDLRQREQERRLTRYAIATVSASVIVALLSGLTVWSELNRKEAIAERLRAKENQARASVNLGDAYWDQNKVLDAELAYATADTVVDEQQTREKMLRARALGIERLWVGAARLGGDIALTTHDGAEMVVALNDHTIGVWDFVTHKRRLTLDAHDGVVTGLALSHDDALVASSDTAGVLALWDRKTGALLARHTGAVGTTIALAFARNRRLISVSATNTVTQLDPRSTDPGQVTTIPGALVVSAIVQPDQNRLIAGDMEGWVRTIDLGTGKDVDAFRADEVPLGAIALDATGTFIATRGDNQRVAAAQRRPMRVRLWMLDQHKQLSELPREVGFPRPNALEFSPDGKQLAIGEIGGSFFLWDLEHQIARALGHTATRAFAFSKDSATLVAVGDTIGAWDVGTSSEINWFQGHSASIEAVAFAPDGAHLASASLDGSIRLWSSGEGKETAVIPVNDKGVEHVAYSPDGSRLLGCTFGGGVVVFDLSHNNRLLNTSVGRTFRGGQQCADFSPVADQLAWIADNNQIVFLTRDGGPTESAPIPTNTAPQVIAYSPDGAMLAVGDDAGGVTLRTVEGGSSIGLLPGLAGPCHAIAWAANGHFVAAASQRQLLVWRTEQPQKPVQVLDLANVINSIAFTADGQRLIAAEYGEVSVIEPFHGAILARFNPSQHFETHVTALAVDRDGFRMALGGNYMPLELFSLERGIEAHTLRSPDRYPGDGSFTPRIAFSTAGRVAAVTSYDTRIRLWDLEGARVIDTIEGTFHRNEGLFYSPDGKSLLSGSPAGDLRIIDVATHATRTVNIITGRPAFNLTPSPDGKRYAFTTTPGTDSNAEASVVGIWDVNRRTIQALLTGHKRNIEALAFHPTKPLLASVSYDRTARIWNLSAPGQYIELGAHGGTVTAAAFSPDGTWLATACRDGVVRIFAADSGKMVKLLRVSSAYAEAVAFTPDGKLLATGGDGSAQLWSVAGWQPVIRMFGHHDGWIQNVAMDPQGQWLLTTSQDEWIRAWRLPTVVEFAEKPPLSIIESLRQRIGWRAIDLPADTQIP